MRLKGRINIMSQNKNNEKFIEEFGMLLRKTFIDLQKKGVIR
jgi:hypothetical protein